jgi:hypothetical protein
MRLLVNVACFITPPNVVAVDVDGDRILHICCSLGTLGQIGAVRFGDTLPRISGPKEGMI